MKKKGFLTFDLSFFMSILVTFICFLLIFCLFKRITHNPHRCDWHLKDGAYAIQSTGRGYYCIWCKRMLTEREYEYSRNYQKGR